MSENNIRLLKNILKAKSDISCEKMNDFNQKMAKYSRRKKDSVRHVTEMDQEFFDTYRQNLFQKKTSATKHTEAVDEFNVRSKKMSQNRKKRLKLDRI